ncbi:MAG: universal stress protein [Gammaproteobacteria bacterium]
MLRYQHILLTTDLAQDTLKLGERARDIAKHSNAKLSVVHVLEYTPVVYGSGEFSIPLDINIEETLRNRATEALADLAKHMDIPPADQYIEIGSIKRTVAILADKIKADLIIVGIHGRRGVEKLLGATANAILHQAKCDVLAVRTYD